MKYEFLKYTYLVIKIAKYNGVSVCICVDGSLWNVNVSCRRPFVSCNFATCSSQFVLQRNILQGKYVNILCDVVLPVLPYFSTGDS
jgi:hypothetical protein